MKKVDHAPDPVSPETPPPAPASPPEPVVEATERKKAGRPKKVAPETKPLVISLLNGYLVVSNVVLINETSGEGEIHVMNGDFNPLELVVGEKVLFHAGVPVGEGMWAVKFDNIIGRLDSDAVANKIEEDVAEIAESVFQGDLGPVEIADAPVDGAISVDLPSPTPVHTKNAAVVFKGGRPAPQDGSIKQLNKPIRR
jgi:hypothetical protein